MKKIRVTVVLAVLQLLIFTSTPANAGIELVCKGRQARSNHRVISVDCSKRKEFVDMLGAAWRKLREEHIVSQYSHSPKLQYLFFSLLS